MTKSLLSFDSYRTLIGTEVGTSHWISVDQSRIDAFADATADHQYIHVDPDKARNSPFGGTIAHGFLSLSLLSCMSFEALPGVEGASASINYGFERIRFVAPIRSGSRVRGRFVLADAKTKGPDQLLLAFQATIEIEGHDKPALSAEWLVLHQR